MLIQAGIRDQWTQSRIAAEIGRDRSVVCRELHRNTHADGQYSAAAAHLNARHRRRRPKPPILCREDTAPLRGFIEDAMDVGWSPKLIADMLRREPDATMGRVSHETIYRALYVQTRGGLRQDLAKQLSLGRSQRKPQGTTERRGRSIYQDAFTISERPPEVEDRAIPGHWEGDLIVGPGSKSAIGTLVERATRFVILLHLPDGHTANQVATQMIQQMRQLPEQLRQSITWDRGTELAEYRRIQTELVDAVYFADPHSPWQRGSNENTNRLLRHWFKKGTDLPGHTQQDLDEVARKLNTRPRPTLDYDTPAKRLNQILVASTS
ncbi:IS30 family transposase [Gulosibacter sp. ACHW.36C]|uniref:IS30 family transposase n=1 Tax=Gulosibacter sediminis TaxID=1729695 RepID=A0ABY4MV09_9MICO|nr:IS30 family transposase [Gulosibacter sediminis]UQN14251.1 IS30 family transposase [Gulosibacter sediminis]